MHDRVAHQEVAHHKVAHHEVAQRHRAPRWWFVPVLVLLALAVACGGDDDADDHDIPAVYIAVIRTLAPDAASVMPKSVYVEALPGTKLSIQDQAAVVKAFEDDTVVRFIDDRNEAVDSNSPRSSVRRDGVLLQMSPAETTDNGLSIKITRYVALDDTRTSCLELEEQSKVWSVATSRDC